MAAETAEPIRSARWSLVRPVRAMAERYIAMVGTAAAVPFGVANPPLPEPTRLAAHRVPVGDTAVFRAEAAATADRRRALHRLVRSDGRHWNAVT